MPEQQHLVMALMYVNAGTPDEATEAVSDAVQPHKAIGSKAVVLSFTPECQDDPRFWRDLERFQVDPGDVRKAVDA